MPEYKQFETGLVLSGGVVRGFAHIGVLKALKEFKIYPDIVSGTSVGAIVAAFYADGYEPEETMEIFEKKKISDMVSIGLKRQGLMQISGLKKLLQKNLKARSFDELKKPLYVTITNLSSGKPEYIGSGELIPHVLASSCIPVIFEPVKINGTYYIDGGITDNFPLFPLEQKCKKIIGVNLMPIGQLDKFKGLSHMLLRAFHISINADTSKKTEKMDIYIEPPGLKKYNLVDIKKKYEMHDIGYQEALKVLNKK